MAKNANPNNLVQALNKVGKYYVNAIKGRLKEKGHYSTGELDRSLDYEIAGQQIDILTTQYGEAVDQGSSVSSQGFGKVSRRFVDDILRWARMKGISPKKGPATEGNMRKMAYAIGRTIQKDGIIQKYGNQGAKVFDQVYSELEEQIGEEILAAYQQDVLEQLNDTITTKKK